MPHYNIDLQGIQNIPFDDYYSNIVTNKSEEIYGIPGKQHYRLLSYFSTLFDNSTIIEIGTHYGHSALALSYNTTNTIYSFDIVNKKNNPLIESRENIHFQFDNLFEQEGREKWRDTILKSAFVFLDVDPHNGTMEWDFYNWLKEIDYRGFVICDDVWFFKDMRDKFWYKIPYEYRYDISEFGHFSGTGIFTFNENITFDKNDNSNWTLVTAYFNLTKCPDASKEIKERNCEYYMSHALSTLSLPYNLVIYCDQDSFETIKAIRPDYLGDKTRYVIREFDDFRFRKNGHGLTLCPEKNNDLFRENTNKGIFLGNELDESFADYRNMINANRKEKPYYFDNRNTASYYLFCMSRYLMLKEAIAENSFGSTHFMWINFCIERMGYTNVMHLDEAMAVNRDKFSTCYIDYIPHSLIKNVPEYFRWGRCSMCSGFFTGNAEYMYKVCDLIENKFLEFLGQGYGHADEQLYSPVYFENPELFEHYYGDYQQMVTNYKYIYENAYAPVHNFIRNSFNNGNYEKCLECCEIVWKSYCLNKCELNEDYLKSLCYYYMMSKKHTNKL